jgi:hypothetical protein
VSCRLKGRLAAGDYPLFAQLTFVSRAGPGAAPGSRAATYPPDPPGSGIAQTSFVVPSQIR